MTFQFSVLKRLLRANGSDANGLPRTGLDRQVAAAVLCCLLAFISPAASDTPTDAQKAVAAAATYESGMNATALRQVEALVRNSAADKAMRWDLEVALCGLLKGNATFEAKRFACQQLAVIGSDAMLPAITELLKSDDTAGIACLALSTTPSKKADDTLRKALGDARGLARVHIINTLGDRRDAKAVSPLAKLARDPDAAAAEAATIALGKIASSAAARALAALRKKPPPAGSSAVVEASLYAADRLAADGSRRKALAIYEELLEGPQRPYVRRAAFEGTLRLDEGNAEKRILDVLRGQDPTLKPAAIAAVPSLQSKDASATFAQELSALEMDERVLLLNALAARGDAEALAALKSHLTAPDTEVSQAAIVGLAARGDASTVPALTMSLALAPNAEERQAAEQALIGLSGGPATDAAILAEFKQAPAETKVRLMPVMPRRGIRDAVPLLLQETAGLTTAKPAFQTVARLATPEDLPALLVALTDLKVDDARGDAETAVAQVASKSSDVAARSRAVCDALAKTTNVAARVSLIGLLPTCGGPNALAVLKAACSDKEAQVSDAAIRALADWPEVTVWDALLAVHRETTNDSHRGLALRGLVRLAGEQNAKPDATLVGRYRQLLDNAKTDDERKLILGALGGAAHPDALKLALPLLEHSALKAEAAAAVKKIAEAIQSQHPQAAQEALDKLK